MKATRCESSATNSNIFSFQACTTKRNELHRKLLQAHRELTDKHKLLQEQLNSKGTIFSHRHYSSFPIVLV